MWLLWSISLSRMSYSGTSMWCGFWNVNQYGLWWAYWRMSNAMRKAFQSCPCEIYLWNRLIDTMNISQDLQRTLHPIHPWTFLFLKPCFPEAALNRQPISCFLAIPSCLSILYSFMHSTLFPFYISISIQISSIANRFHIYLPTHSFIHL